VDGTRFDITRRMHMAEKIEGRARELLEGKNFVTLGSIAKDGRPQLNVIWGDVEGDQVRVNSAEGRQWPKNLRRDPRVTLTVMNQENPYEYGVIVGRVTEDTHEGADEHIDSLAKKYLDADTYPYRQEGEQRVMFKIEPEKVSMQGG
jgi:PPOX class probable F420-dependent enzyme